MPKKSSFAPNSKPRASEISYFSANSSKALSPSNIQTKGLSSKVKESFEFMNTFADERKISFYGITNDQIELASQYFKRDLDELEPDQITIISRMKK